MDLRLISLVTGGVLLSSLLLVRCQDDFYFSNHPQNLPVREGESVDLECMVSNTSFIRFYWQLDGQTVWNSSRRFQRGSNLHITRVDRKLDRGDFTCIAHNVTTGFSLTSLAASLNIQWLDRSARVQLLSPEDPDRIRSGSDVVLLCEANGSGRVTYEWFKNGERLTRGKPAGERDEQLRLSGVSAEDNGVYSCRATNAAGSVDSDVTMALVVHESGAAEIQVVPTDQLVRRGSTARFHCQYRQADTVRWYRSQRGPITSQGRFTVLENNTLLIADVGPEDEGVYHCRATTRGPHPVSQTYSARLQLAYLVELGGGSVEPAAPVPGVHVVPEGRRFQLTCVTPPGRPRPRVRWLLPSGRAAAASTDAVTPPGPEDTAELSLDSAQVSDTGNYTCLAENLAGTSRLQQRIIVATPPELVSGPIDRAVDEGGRTELTCQYRGLPPPFTSVAWLKNGKPTQAGQVSLENGSLIIPLTELTDAGKYQCVINTTGFPPYSSSQATLTVKEKLKFAPVPVSRSLELGAPGRLYCRASGATPPTVRWLKLDRAGRPVFDWPRHIRDMNGTLYLERVTEADQGQYTCVATNPQGFINATINVTIIAPPKFLETPHNPTEAVVGQPLMLHCRVTGKPQPSVQWDRNTKLNAFDTKRVTQFENGSLYIGELRYEDEGRYGCIAGNSGGLVREEIHLIVRSSEAEILDRSLTPGVAGDDGSLMTKTVIITLSAAGSYLLLVACLTAWCRYRRSKRKQMYMRASTEGTSVLLGKTDREEPVGGASGAAGAASNGSARYMHCPAGGQDEPPAPARHIGSPAGHSSYQSIRSDSSSQPSGGSRSHASPERQPLLDRDRIQPVMSLGQGDFGEVYLAKLLVHREVERDRIVMVKALQSREDTALCDFAREAELYGKVCSANVARLLFVCRDREPHLVVLEYTDWGDLKQFLLATRGDTTRKPPHPPPLQPEQAASVCLQLAAGLEHIHKNRFIHRDVATRNCILTSQLEVKLSCACLSQDTYRSEYSPLRGHLLPLRWLPPEAALEDDFSSKSDVWSWAVLCWEVFHQAELPYSTLSDQQLLASVRQRTAGLDVPESVPEPLGQVMTRCWAGSPRDRPDMADVVTALSE